MGDAGNVLTYGSTAGELATQGKIVDSMTGKKLWEFDTIKDDPKSWPGEIGLYGGAWVPGITTRRRTRSFMAPATREGLHQLRPEG
jgi:hypothetical protein